MAKYHKITPTITTVVGDSLTLPRQFQQVAFHHTYPYLSVQWLRDRGGPAEVWGSLGVVDCSPRPIPSWLRRVVAKLPVFLRSPIIIFPHNYRIQILRYKLDLVFTKPRGLRRVYQRLLDQMQQDFCRVYAINIIPPGAYFESRSPSVGREVQTA